MEERHAADLDALKRTADDELDRARRDATSRAANMLGEFEAAQAYLKSEIEKLTRACVQTLAGLPFTES